MLWAGASTKHTLVLRSSVGLQTQAAHNTNLHARDTRARARAQTHAAPRRLHHTHSSGQHSKKVMRLGAFLQDKEGRVGRCRKCMCMCTKPWHSVSICLHLKRLRGMLLDFWDPKNSHFQPKLQDVQDIRATFQCL